jgi:hypothetical protein
MINVNFNLYLPPFGNAVFCMASFIKDSKFFTFQGNYLLGENFSQEVVDLAKKYEFENVLLSSYLPNGSERFFKKINKEDLFQVANSLKEKGIEARVLSD